MNPTFTTTQNGIEIIDPIERHRYRLTTHEPVTLRSVDRGRVPYPVDSAVELTTDRLTLPVLHPVYVYETDRMVDEVRPDERLMFADDEYAFDISVQIKVYAVFEGSGRIYSDMNQTHIELDEPTRVIVGARSYHTRPAETITTTAAPVDAMRAVSAFGSALKTTTPERSFPTMRGHPPAVALGDELGIPETITRPETGVTLEVPEALPYVFAVAPLAYYLGATVVPGATPRVRTSGGYTHRLDGPDGFETAVERTLKRIFFLDCLVRTEGITSLPLSERGAIATELEFDGAALYDRPLAEQLEAYLDVPFSVVEPHFPEWRLETQTEATADQLPFLPFIANELSIVRVRDGLERSAATSRVRKRHSNEVPPETSAAAGSPAPESRSTRSTIEQSWTRPSGARIASTTPISAYTNSVDQTPKEEPIEIEVICNDPDMSGELVTVHGAYGKRDELPFDVTIHHELTAAELEAVLRRESDFVHYIGHIDSGGIRCADGRLDVSSIGTVGAKSFFLNACQSHEQGLQLIEAGSIGGIVTFSDVENSDAVTAGGTIARLLNRGYSFYAAVDIVRAETTIGKHYHVVGNGRATVAQPESGVPNACLVETRGEEIRIEIHDYLFGEQKIGSLSIPYLDSIDTYHLLPKKLGPFTVTKPELVHFLDRETIPVLLDGTLRWSDEIGVNEL